MSGHSPNIETELFITGKKTRHLLAHKDMDDRKPSQFLSHLQSLSETVVPDNLVRSLSSQRLITSHIIASKFWRRRKMQI